MSALPVLHVELDGPTGRNARVSLDGHDISNGLLELDICLRCDDLTRANLVIDVGALEIDAPTLALLQANVRVAEAAAPELELRTFGEELARA